MTAPIAALQVRIASIQSRFDLPGARTPASSPGFAAILAGATSGSNPAGTATVVPSTLSAQATTLDTSGGGIGLQTVALAMRQLGVPYAWGGTTPGGFDCSGLVQYAFRQAGVDLPRTSQEQARAGQAVPSLAAARPGDLVAFGSPVDHIGIYAGNNTMVVAPHRGDVVKVQTIYRTPTAIRRVAA